MTQQRVRTYQRRTKSGGKTTVHQHTRRRYGPNLRHAGKLGKRGVQHGMRGRKGKAAMFLLGALLEVAAFLALNGTALILTLIAGVLVMLSVVLSGWRPR